MGTTNSIKIRKGLVLYQQVWSSSWYARVYMTLDGQFIHTRSTKTSVLKDAMKKAEGFYLDCLLAQRGDAPLPSRLVKRQDPKKRFDHAYDAYLDSIELDAGSDKRKLNEFRNKRQLHTAMNGFAKFFGRDDISTLTTDRIKEYLRYQAQHSKSGKLSPSTLKKSVNTLSQFLQFTAQSGLIEKIPLMPKIKEQDQPRPWFNHKEYRSLYTKAYVLARQAKNRGENRESYLWYEMAYFVIFMVNAFLRSSEWASLQHRHVELREGDNPSLKIAVFGKTGPRYTISMPRAVEVYRRILKRTDSNPATHLFLSDIENRETARDKMRDRFEILLAATGLKYDALGRARVVHCLRHSSLMFGLLDGVDHFTLAKNAGTSVQQLERFYCSHYTADMNLKELHKSKAWEGM